MWHRRPRVCAELVQCARAYVFLTAIRTTACSVRRPRPGNTSGQDYRDDPGTHHPWPTRASPQTVPLVGRIAPIEVD